MTIEIDEVFIDLNMIYSVKYGDDWLGIIGEDKYFKARDKYISSSKKDKEKYLNGELLF